MTDATRILHAISSGDRHAAEELLPLVYDELRQLAAHRLSREAPGQAAGAGGLIPGCGKFAFGMTQEAVSVG